MSSVPVVLLALVATRAVPFGLMAWAVRAQLACLRGFDLSLAAAAVLSAEVFLALLGHTQQSVVPVIGALALSLVCSSSLVAVWSYAASRYFRKADSSGELVLVASLGLSAIVTGTIGGLRGGGLRNVGNSLRTLAVNDDFLDEVTMTAVIIALLAGLLLTIFSKSRSGVSLELLAQDRDFAEELGVQAQSVAPISGALAGALAGGAGVCLAVVGGSNPEMGLGAFLYGAGGALLLPRVSPSAAILGGAAVAAVQVLLEYSTSASAAQAALFTLILGLVLTRGSSRTSRGER